MPAKPNSAMGVSILSWDQTHQAYLAYFVRSIVFCHFFSHGEDGFVDAFSSLMASPSASLSVITLDIELLI